MMYRLKIKNNNEGKKWDIKQLSNIDCLQGNTTYITRTEGEGDICQSYCPEGSQYYYY